MKRAVLLVLAAFAGAAIATFIADRQNTKRYAEWATLRSGWEAERADLQSALEGARSEAVLSSNRAFVPHGAPVVSSHARDWVDQLVAMPARVVQPESLRRAVSLLDRLVELGVSSLPEIRRVLLSGRDAVYEAPGSGSPARDPKGLVRALVPRTLRLGLFDAVRQIGGPAAESILAESLTSTARGVEVACLAQCLDELAPGKHREAIIAAAQKLLAGGAAEDREPLFAVLRQCDDVSFVAAAQHQLLQAGGKIDRGALRYLRHSLGEQTVPLAAQIYESGMVTDPDSKEPLGRLALNYVGANAQAAELYHRAILDPALKPDQRRELVEDLNQDGITSEKNPTPEDLKIISNRYALTQAYLQQNYVLTNRVLNEAFREADKDLRNMLQRAATNNGRP